MEEAETGPMKVWLPFPKGAVVGLFGIPWRMKAIHGRKLTMELSVHPGVDVVLDWGPMQPMNGSHLEPESPEGEKRGVKSPAGENGTELPDYYQPKKPQNPKWLQDLKDIAGEIDA